MVRELEERESSDSEKDLFAESSDEDDDSIDEAVYDLGDGESEEDGEGEDEEDDDDSESDQDVIEEAMQGGGKKALYAKQAKLLSQKLKLQQKEEGASDEESEEDKTWGTSKQAYYNADTVEADSEDEEDLKDEEAEALKLQKERVANLSAADYGLDAGFFEGEEEEEATLEALVKKGGRRPQSGAKGGKGTPAALESLSRDLTALSRQERVAALLARSPELLSILQELQESLAETRYRFGPLLSELKDGGLCTSAGLSYLEAKHLLLASYAEHLAFYLLLKAEDRPVADHPVVARVVELKAYLDKLRPIDLMHQQQLRRLLRATEVASTQAPAGEKPKAEDKPAVAAPAAKALQPKQQQQQQQPTKKTAPSTADTSDSDEEATLLLAGGEVALLKARQRAESRAQLDEQSLGGGAALSKVAVRRIQLQKRKGAAPASLVDDFGDDVPMPAEDLLSRKKVSQSFGGNHPSLGQKPRGGDEDLPAKEPLYQRRAKFDAAAARRAAQGDGEAAEGDGYDFDFEGKKAKRGRDEAEDGDGDGEDAFFKESKAKAEIRKRLREDAHRAPAPAVPVADPLADGGVRAISNAIQRNRGLTPHRRRDLKNPRKKNRVKYEKAQIRHKGAVQPMREKEGLQYGGEATGIKSRVTKGRRLG